MKTEESTPSYESIITFSINNNLFPYVFYVYN